MDEAPASTLGRQPLGLLQHSLQRDLTAGAKQAMAAQPRPAELWQHQTTEKTRQPARLGEHPRILLPQRQGITPSFRRDGRVESGKRGMVQGESACCIIPGRAAGDMTTPKNERPSGFPALLSALTIGNVADYLANTHTTA